MKKTRKSGNVVNIANFKRLHNRCEAIGEKYNPSPKALKLESLANLHTAASEAQSAVNNAKAEYQRQVATRQAAFRAVRPFATRAFNAFTSCDPTPRSIPRMRHIVCKIRGMRITPLPKYDPASDDPNAKPATHSVSQQSFTSLIDHLQKMHVFLDGRPEYQPNEPELTVDGLAAFIADLKAKDSAATRSLLALDNARNLRNTLLYAPRTGLVDVALATKRYTRSLGAKQYKKVSSIPFRNILKRKKR